MILSICAFAIAVALYTISQLQQQSKLRGQKGDASFWGERSWERKYKARVVGGTKSTIDVEVKERWPTSSTLTVFLTDGYHLMQFCFTILFCLSAVSYEREFGFWIDGCVYWGVWHLSFWSVYNSLQRKNK